MLNAYSLCDLFSGAFHQVQPVQAGLLDFLPNVSWMVIWPKFHLSEAASIHLRVEIQHLEDGYLDLLVIH